MFATRSFHVLSQLEIETVVCSIDIVVATGEILFNNDRNGNENSG